MEKRLVELIRDANIDWLLQEYDRETNQRIEEYVASLLLANGVIVPPCKVGDNVWVVYTPRWPANPADKGKWFMREDGVQRIIYGAKGLSIETWNMGTISAKEFGVKLFFVKEKAEQALAERKQG